MRLTQRGALDVTPPKPTAFAKVEAFVVQDVPPEIDECELCREPDCTQAQWLVCRRRLDAVAKIERIIPGQTANNRGTP